MIKFVNESAIQQNYKALKMEIAKVSAIFGAFVNLFLYVGAWFANLDSIKSTILFILAILMTMHRWYRWSITSSQNKRLKDIKIKEEELRIQEIEISHMERLAKIQSKK